MKGRRILPPWRDARVELGAVGRRMGLLFDVLFKDGKRSAPRGYEAVGTMPKHGLPIELTDMGFMHSPYPPGGSGLDVVHQVG